MKSHYENCPTCEAKNSIQIEVSDPTDDGFVLKINKCTNCGEKHQYIRDEESYFKLVKYEQDESPK